MRRRPTKTNASQNLKSKLVLAVDLAVALRRAGAAGSEAWRSEEAANIAIKLVSTATIKLCFLLFSLFLVSLSLVLGFFQAVLKRACHF